MSILTVKIPKSIHVRLKRTSQFNNVPMGELVANGLLMEFGKHVPPPEKWGREE